MKAFAIILDTRPSYLAGARPADSLLLAPLGPGTVLGHLARGLAAAGHEEVTVVADFEPDAEYVQAVMRARVRVSAVVSAHAFLDRLEDDEPSDWLVIVDPRCVPTAALPAGILVPEPDLGPRPARHLVALEHHPGGTTERVQLGADGTVGRIRRYYDSATWPFTSGVAASVVPVSGMVPAGDLSLTSLRELRRGLTERGVPSRDVFLRGGAFDLSRERDLLALSEKGLLDHFARRGPAGASWPEVGAGGGIDPTARLVGPVLVQEGARIGPEAVVIGPAVVGPRACIGPAATVAQCVVGAEADVAEGLVLRHRALFGAVSDAGVAATPTSLADAAPDPADHPPDVADEGRPVSAVYRALKPALDVTLAVLGLVLLGPLFLLVALLVKLDSKGPVLYRGRREGLGGRAFECLKFRTMLVGAEAQQRELYGRNQVDGPQFKLAHDPRVTRVGRLLRAANLDELPQLLNVVRLEMSLVGPRPSPFRENQLCIPWRDARLSVRPGITGLWQVCRHDRAQGDFHQWIHFDLLYVRNLSFVVDLKILAATAATLGGHWPAPLAWIVPARHRDAAVSSPITSNLDGEPI